MSDKARKLEEKAVQLERDARKYARSREDSKSMYETMLLLVF